MGLLKKILATLSRPAPTAAQDETPDSGAPSIYLEFAGRNHHWTKPLYKTRAETVTVGLDLAEWISDRTINDAVVSYEYGQGLSMLTPVVYGPSRAVVSLTISEGRFGTHNTLALTMTLDEAQVIQTMVPISVLR